MAMALCNFPELTGFIQPKPENVAKGRLIFEGADGTRIECGFATIERITGSRFYSGLEIGKSGCSESICRPRRIELKVSMDECNMLVMLPGWVPPEREWIPAQAGEDGALPCPQCLGGYSKGPFLVCPACVGTNLMRRNPKCERSKP